MRVAEDHRKIMGKSWENHRTIIGKASENHRTIIGKSSENIGAVAPSTVTKSREFGAIFRAISPPTHGRPPKAVARAACGPVAQDLDGQRCAGSGRSTLRRIWPINVAQDLDPQNWLFLFKVKADPAQR